MGVELLDPATRVADVRRALAKAALTLTRRAYRTRGITNDPAIARRMREADRPRRELRHFVFGRDGEPCYRCATPIDKRTVAGRRLYACEGCQG